MDILRIVVKKRTEDQDTTNKDSETLGRFASRVAKLRGEGPMATSDEPEVALEVVSINISDIEVPPNYLRKSTGNVDSLVASVRVFGIQQPIKVVKLKGTKKYRLVFGRRRLKAAETAGLDAVPCIVELVTREDRLQMLALAENTHRAPVSPIEEGTSYQQLLQKNDIDEISKTLGVDKGTMQQTIEFLELPGGIRKDVMNHPDFFTFAILLTLMKAFRQSKVHGKKLMNAIVAREVKTSAEAESFLAGL